MTHDDTMHRSYDKDYKRLNKLATANRVTTCIDQYKFRNFYATNVRLKDPNASVMRSLALQKGAIRPEHEFFGRPNRPSTPVKNVVNFDFGTSAEVR